MNFPSNQAGNTPHVPPAVGSPAIHQHPNGLGIYDSPPRLPHTEEEVIDCILDDDNFVCWCLVALYEQQTEIEKAVEKTISGNGAGFSKANAATLGYMAEKLLAGKILTSGDFAYCREILRNGLPRLGKYRRQLLELVRSYAAMQVALEAVPEVMQ